MGMICASDMPDGGVKVVFLDEEVPAGTKNKINRKSPAELNYMCSIRQGILMP